jgi:hypothetical protein
MGCFYVHLAPELWQMVAKLLGLKDLNSLSRSSSYLLGVIRPILYRAVHLRYQGPGKSDDTLRLLAYDKELAGHILAFSISAPQAYVAVAATEPPEPIPTYYSESICNMTSLKSLELRGSIFNDMSEQREFVRKLRERERPLEELFVAVGYVSLPKFPEDDFPLPNLKSLS